MHLDSTKAATLIARPNQTRDFGHDTTNIALGKLQEVLGASIDHKIALKLSEADCAGALQGLSELAAQCAKQKDGIPVSHENKQWKIKFWVQVSQLSSFSQNAEKPHVLGLGKAVKFNIVVKHKNRRHTEIHIKIFRDKNSNYWLTVFANPTSLLLSYNAFAVALNKPTRHAERRSMMRVPLIILRQIIRSGNPDFDWSDDTRLRIKDLQFRVCPSQIFTYLPTAPFTPEKIMGYLRCVYATAYGDGQGTYRLISDDLDLDVECKRAKGSCQTLLFVFRYAGRVFLSVSFYDKLAKATEDAKVIKAKLGGKKVQEFLSSHLRVDITLHEQAQLEMASEAGFGEKNKLVATADLYCRAISAMDRGQGESGQKFILWLLNYIFDEVLGFWYLIKYEPKKLKRARAALAEYDQHVAKVFDEWCELGFVYCTDHGLSKCRRVSFEQFSQHHASTKLSRERARRAKEKLLNAGINPDIPKRAYEAFYAKTYSWDMTDIERAEYCEALESRDAGAIQKLHGISRRNSMEIAADICLAFQGMVESAHVPASALMSRDDA